MSEGVAGARGAVVKSLANHAIVHQKRVRGCMIAFSPRFEQCARKPIVRLDRGVTRELPGNARNATQHNPERQRSLLMTALCPLRRTWPTKDRPRTPNLVDDCRDNTEDRDRLTGSHGESGNQSNCLSDDSPPVCLTLLAALDFAKPLQSVK